MPLARCGELQIEYEDRGMGEPVVLVHGGMIGAYYWEPLTDELLKRSARRIIAYDRRGFGRSSPGNEPVTFKHEAGDLKCLLESLGVGQAHLVGHSYGGFVALELAMEYPETVRTLTLMEPVPFAFVPSAPAFFAEGKREREAAGKVSRAEALDLALRAVCGQNYRDYLRPGWWERVVADASTGRRTGVNLAEYRPSVGGLEQVRMPVLNVLGGESHAVSPIFPEGHDVLMEWFPHADEFVLARATHSLHGMNPGDLAEALDGFFAKHPATA